MIMDPSFTEYPDFTNGFRNQNQTTFLANSTQFTENYDSFSPQFSPDFGLSFDNNHVFLPPDPELSYFNPSTAPISDRESPPSAPSTALSPDDTEFSETVKYISQILMEENMEEKPTMFYDPLGLQDTEKSFYDVLGESYPYSVDQNLGRVETPDSIFSVSSLDYGGGNSTSPSTSTNSASSPQLSSDSGDFKPFFVQSSSQRDDNSQLTSQPVSRVSAPTGSNIGDLFPGVEELLAQNIFGNSDSILQFQRGLEEASKFLPKSNQLIIDIEGGNFSPEAKTEAAKFSTLSSDAPKRDRETSPNEPRAWKSHHEREYVDSDEERSNKQSAVYTDESEELSEMFDKVLLNVDHSCCKEQCNENGTAQIEASKPIEQPQAGIAANGNGKGRNKRQGRKKETVDLRTLLILCAQAVSASDRRTSEELLKQIRQHSSSTGDGSQRLAHYFANGLEARLAGTGTGTKLYYTTMLSKCSAAGILKAYKLNLSSCPFKKMAIFFANKTIMKAAENAKCLHIVDFGILYGFQWPILIQFLAKRAGGPPKLRITGIEYPQKGFRPAERIEDTGRRLKKYCERFGVAFEYNAIAAEHWETIRLEDIKIRSDEVLAVNCLMRFKNLMDETVEVNCPRNAVLNLIRKMNPKVFVQSIANGAYNAPFFVTRFREALFHFSALFDALDTNIARDNEERMMYEKEFYGREAMNVIACEGLDRVERPETYKQWQVRNMRAGFRSVPLDQELMGKFREKLKLWYHKDFVMDEDGNWLLQGWKGRIVYASSCWVPV